LLACYGGGASLCTARPLFEASLPESAAIQTLAKAAATAAQGAATSLLALAADDRVVPDAGLVSAASLSATAAWDALLVVSSLPYGADAEAGPAMPGAGPWVQCNLFWHGWALPPASVRGSRGAGAWPLALPAGPPEARGTIGGWRPARADGDPAWLDVGRAVPCDVHCHTVGGPGAGGDAAAITAALRADGMSDADVAAALDAMGVSASDAPAWHLGGDTGRVAVPAGRAAAGWFVALDASGREPRGIAVLLVTVPGEAEAAVEGSLRAAGRDSEAVSAALRESLAAAGATESDLAAVTLALGGSRPATRG